MSLVRRNHVLDRNLACSKARHDLIGLHAGDARVVLPRVHEERRDDFVGVAQRAESLEELAIRGREQFLSAGGERFDVLACLNAGEAGMTMLEKLVRRELEGWI